VREHHFAIVIGIQRYPYLEALQGAVQDAADFRDWLVRDGGLRQDHIEEVTSTSHNNPDDRPVLQDIDDAFEKTFARAQQCKTTEAKRLYVYFAGHGCCSEDFTHVALLMANAKVGALGYSANASGYHAALAHQAIFLEQLFFYDCCRNFDRRVRGRGPPWVGSGEPSPSAKDVQQYPLYGASSGQSSYERPPSGGAMPRGLFTRALLEGLRGGFGGACVRLGNELVVTTKSLGDYVYKRLKQLAQEEGVDQQPFHNPAGPPVDLTLARLPDSAYELHVQLRAPSTETAVEIKDRDCNLVRTVDMGGPPEALTLPWGLYVLRTVPGGRKSYIDPWEIRPGQEIVVNF